MSSISRNIVLHETRIWQDEHGLTIINNSEVLMYHSVCGGLMMQHRLDGVPATNTEPLCYCYRVPIDEQEPINATQQILTEVYQGLRKCETISDARLLVESLAAREEMKEQQSA